MSEETTYTITRTAAVHPGTETVTLALSPRLTFKVGESHDAKTDRVTAAQLKRDGYEVDPVDDPDEQVEQPDEPKNKTTKAKKADKE